MGRAPSVLSMVRVTSARPSGGRPVVPAKMTSSILPPRNALAPCSPITQDNASTTLDLPEPLGPTTQVMPGSKRSVVAEAKDLKPFSVRLFKCTVCRTLPGSSPVTSLLWLPAQGTHARTSRRNSALDEAGDATPGVGEALGDLLHVPGRGSRAQRGEQPFTGHPRPLGDHLDPSIGQVRRMADQPQLKCPPSGPPAKSDTLHLTMHPGRHPHLIPRRHGSHDLGRPASSASRLQRGVSEPARRGRARRLRRSPQRPDDGRSGAFRPSPSRGG